MKKIDFQVQLKMGKLTYGLLEKLPKVSNDLLGWPWDTETNPDLYKSELVYPKITIVTPSFNQGQFLEETIRSILLQNYPNLEYIIIDGGSTDGSVDIIRKYEKWITYWTSVPDYGQSHAINKGFSLASGEILNWINSDDCLNKNALFEISRSFLEQTQRNDYVLLVGNGTDIDAKSEILRERFVYDNADSKNSGILFSGNPPQQSIFFTANLFKEVGGVNILLKYSMDIDLFMRFIQLIPKVLIVNASIGSFRVHSASKTSNSLAMILEKLALFEGLKSHIDKNYCKRMISSYVLNLNFSNVQFKQKLNFIFKFLINVDLKETYKYKRLSRKLLGYKK